MTQQETEARLHRAWDWLAQNPKHPRFAVYEEAFLCELRDYERAMRLTASRHQYISV